MKSNYLHILFLLLLSTVAFSQEMRVVSGVIKDSDGEPITGVNVIQKGTANGVMTNIDGYYEIKAPLGSTLQFTFIGMRSSEMVVSGSNSKPADSQATAAKSSQPPTAEGNKTDKKEGERLEITPSRENQSLSPYFLVKSDSPEEIRMPLRKTDVAANIAKKSSTKC